FNHLSFLFFRISPREVENGLYSSVASLNTQLYEQIKNELPNAMQEAGFLMRILPPSLLSRIMLLYQKGQLGSFNFASLAKSTYPEETFMESNLKNFLHMPRLPVPPGIGIFFARFQGGLNLSVTCLEGILGNEEMDRIKNDLRKILLQYE
ncbi:MAG: hypothetical protein ACOCZ2_02660, partial [Thermodesulfobacteriota bacterium]